MEFGPLKIYFFPSRLECLTKMLIYLDMRQMAVIFSRERAAGEPAATAPEAAAAAAGRTKRRPERADTEEDEDSTSSATVSRSSTFIVL
jgi:hypothetical protein